MFLDTVLEWFQVSREVARFKRKEEQLVKERYHKNSRFYSMDRALKRAYRFKNPYTISRKFWAEHIYGETPLTSLELIGEKLKLSPSEHFVDLGAGRGRGVFFMHERFGCTATGVERVPIFIANAKQIQNLEALNGVQFIEADLLDAVLDPKDPMWQGSVFYVAWTCFSEELIERLTERFEALPEGVRVITISGPLLSPYYTCIECFTVPFPWGNGSVFIQQKLR
ncbi:MAG: class I SAM-dependent methyltransferase [Simkania sp.]|nr:class I SAM-dependent methyltransferase [Simkania sp.]